MRAELAATVQTQRKPEAAEGEHAKLRSAVDEAVERNIVREEVFAGPDGSRDFYLLSSSHYGNNDFDPDRTPEDTKMSHAQLFQLAHLLHKRGLRSPIFVEGRCFRHGYANRTLEVAQQEGMDIMSPQMQQQLAEKPEELIDLMNRHQRLRKARGMTAPNFFLYTAYPHIAGGHQEQSEVIAKRFTEVWMPWMEQFNAKYLPVLQQKQDGESGTKRRMEIQRGWDKQRACLKIGEKWYYAEDVAQDCEWYLQFSRELAQFDKMREADVTDLMLNTRPDLVPMCSYGLAHTFRIKQLLKSLTPCSIHVLTPLASTHLDHLRSSESEYMTFNGLSNADFARKLQQATRSVPPPRH
ncbi:MAG: hypothetical protein PHE68_04270 [Candidatus Peribacteraceae bacterium]|nr:hypothetical protein [Candidatus Peribacteraceae bacterium]MDD5074751.1 hypothetical protein [Candidatus Peribacteraceae bacterium]